MEIKGRSKQRVFIILYSKSTTLKGLYGTYIRMFACTHVDTYNGIMCTLLCAHYTITFYPFDVNKLRHRQIIG